MYEFCTNGLLEALFYDYPLEMAIEKIEDFYLSSRGRFDDLLKDKYGKDVLPSILRERMSGYSISDTKAITEWFKVYCNKINGHNIFDKIFSFLSSVVEPLFSNATANPRVSSSNLQEWKDLSSLITEDLLVTAHLAARNKNIVSFLWEDCIPVYGNCCLNYELSDVHLHLSSSSDAFSMGWIYRMNNYESHKDDTDRFVRLPKCNLDDQISQELSIDFWSHDHFDNHYMEWVEIAAIIRYWMYKLIKVNQLPSDDDLWSLFDSIDDPVEALYLKSSMFKEIEGERNNNYFFLNTYPRIKWDYAIDTKNKSLKTESPYMILFGERKLLYVFFRKLYSRNTNAVKFAPLAWLYILIKNHIRKQYIQTNKHIGLENHQIYSQRFDEFVKLKREVVGSCKKRYVAQTAMGKGKCNSVEIRVTGYKNIFCTDIAKSLVGDSEYCSVDDIKDNISLVCGMTKGKDLLKLKTEAEKIFCHYDKPNDNKVPVVGVDFAGNDRDNHPDVFVDVIKKMRFNGLYNMTYHIGEDFYDLLDGLRAIDELIELLEWKYPCRMGHALAIATDVEGYYKKRNYSMILPSQVLLDNLVWLRKCADCLSYKIVDGANIDNEIIELYNSLYHSSPWNFDNYWDSILLRAYSDKAIEEDSIPLPSENEKIVSAWSNKFAVELRREYIANRKQGDEDNVIWTLPQSCIPLIEHIQVALMHKIAERGITIETCPSSNLKIGHFDRYDELPTITIPKKMSDIKISINTDVKGVIPTSIENEYALIAYALSKSGKSDDEIKSFLQKVAMDAKDMRFKPKRHGI